MGRIIKKTIEEAFYTEEEAAAAIQEAKESALRNATTLKSIRTRYTTKKSKGEIVGERWVNTIVEEYQGLWDE